MRCIGFDFSQEVWDMLRDPSKLPSPLSPPGSESYRLCRCSKQPVSYTWEVCAGCYVYAFLFI